MNPVKTYQNVNKRDEMLSFGISKMEDVYEKKQGAVDEPHRHNYYTVLVVQQANGIHIIDFHSYPLEDRQIYFVSPGQVHQVIEKEQSTGFVLTFSTDFLIQNSIPLSFISDLNLFQNYGETPPLQPNEDVLKKIVHFSSEIFELFSSQQHHKFLSIGAYLKLLLIQCSNVCTLHSNKSEHETTRNNIIRDFKSAVEEHYKENHSTTFYANLLNITPDHLNRSIKQKIGKTAKEYIQSRITTEAKRLLYFTDLTNKEIGYQLGFSDPANFSASFKKSTRLSPSNFKKQELKS
jgi:AraC-like DNA-binding protein